MGLEVTAVSTRAGSTRLRDFGYRHEIPHVFVDWKAMLAEPQLWDALVIATHTDGTPEVLSAALPLNVPVLVEKPVAWSSKQIEELSTRVHDRVIVGYNRRFYRPVRYARQQMCQGPPLLAHLSLPEGIHPPFQNGESHRWYLEPFFENSCHGLDLLRFLFGDLQIEFVRHIKTPLDGIAGLSAILSSQRGDCIQLTANWGAPANFSLFLDRSGLRLELCPFELATLYEGMDVLGPTNDFPIRRYVPRVSQKIGLEEIDKKEKPGFVKQAEVLQSMIEGLPPDPLAAGLEDALAVSRLCEQLIGQTHISMSVKE